jgi:hypothetical protein
MSEICLLRSLWSRFAHTEKGRDTCELDSTGRLTKNASKQGVRKQAIFAVYVLTGPVP